MIQLTRAQHNALQYVASGYVVHVPRMGAAPAQYQVRGFYQRPRQNPYERLADIGYIQTRPLWDGIAPVALTTLGEQYLHERT